MVHLFVAHHLVPVAQTPALQSEGLRIGLLEVLFQEPPKGLKLFR
jgi:hypothetical protein